MRLLRVSYACVRLLTSDSDLHRKGTATDTLDYIAAIAAATATVGQNYILGCASGAEIT